MKKTLMMFAVGALVMTVGFAAYAHYEDSRGRGRMNGSRGGGMMYGRQGENYGPQGNMMYGNGQRKGMMRGGRGGRMHAQGQMQGRGRADGMNTQGRMQGRGRANGMYAQGQQMQGRSRGGRWNQSRNAACPYAAEYGRWNGSSQQQQNTTVPDMLSEDKVKETAQEYLAKYLSGYSIDTVEEDEWRPLYTVTVKGENDAVQKMVVHGFNGKVIHVSPEESVEVAPAE